MENQNTHKTILELTEAKAQAIELAKKNDILERQIQKLRHESIEVNEEQEKISQDYKASEELAGDQ